MKLGKFLSDYLSAETFEGPMTVTIRKVEVRTIGGAEEEKEEKLALSFVELDQSMVLNRTNLKMLAGLWGDETESWLGKKIEIYVDEAIAFRGKVVAGLRIRIPK